MLICTTFRLNITCSTQEVFSLLKGFNRLKQNRSPLLYQLVANKAYRVTREKKCKILMYKISNTVNGLKNKTVLNFSFIFFLYLYRNHWSFLRLPVIIFSTTIKGNICFQEVLCTTFPSLKIQTGIITSNDILKKLCPLVYAFATPLVQNILWSNAFRTKIS